MRHHSPLGTPFPASAKPLTSILRAFKGSHIVCYLSILRAADSSKMLHCSSRVMIKLLTQTCAANNNIHVIQSYVHGSLPTEMVKDRNKYLFIPLITHSSWQNTQHINNWHHKIIHKYTIDILGKSLAFLKLPCDRNVIYQHNIWPKHKIKYVSGKMEDLSLSSVLRGKFYLYVSLSLSNSITFIVLPHFLTPFPLISKLLLCISLISINQSIIIIFLSTWMEQCNISLSPTLQLQTFISLHYHHCCLILTARNTHNCYITPL